MLSKMWEEIHSQTSWWRLWSLENDKQYNLTLYDGYDYLSMLQLKFIQMSKRKGASEIDLICDTSCVILMSELCGVSIMNILWIQPCYNSIWLPLHIHIWIGWCLSIVFDISKLLHFVQITFCVTRNGKFDQSDHHNIPYSSQSPALALIGLSWYWTWCTISKIVNG